MFGACFAVKKVSEEFCETIRVRYGHVSDDLERSLRVYAFGGPRSVGRLQELMLVKYHRPGQYDKNKGGISALFPSDDGFKLAKERQIHSLASEFKDVIRQVPLQFEVGKKWSAGWAWGPARGR